MTNISLLNGNWGLYYESMKAIHAALAPGGGLDQMNSIMIQSLTMSFDKLGKSESFRINLAAWLRHEVTMATSEAVYGPGNPLRDPEVENGFW